MPCLITTAENSAAARIERKDALRELAYGTLMVRFMAATASPLSMIPTPAWGDKQANTRLIDVIDDQLAGRDSDALWSELVTILASTPKGLEWLRERAKDYAAWHEEAESAGGWA